MGSRSRGLPPFPQRTRQGWGTPLRFADYPTEMRTTRLGSRASQSCRSFLMKKLHSALALAILSTSLMGGVALAQDHHDNHAYVEHKEWEQGAPIRHEDWDRGDKVDYRQYK